MSEDADAVDDEHGLIFPSPWVGVATLFLAVQAVLTVYLFTLEPETAPTYLSGSAVLLSVFAATAVGYDAWRYPAIPGTWSPRTPLWALAVLLPGINVGVLVAYTLRRLQTANPRLERLWGWPAAGASAISGITALAVLSTGTTAPPLSPLRSVFFFATSAFAGLATPAAYYDTRYVDGRFEAVREDWTLGGYHWVALLSVPHPLRVLLAGLYLVRRRSLVGKLPAETEPVGPGPEDGKA